QSPNESREDRHARFADVYTEAAGHAGAAGTPPPAACKSAAVANCHPSQDYSVGQGSSDDWISPPRCHEPSRALGPSLPPPPPAAAAEAPAATLLFSSDSPVAARPSLSCSRQEAEKDAGLPCTGRHYSPNDAVQLRRGEPQLRRQQFQSTERRTPPRDLLRQQQEQQQAESASKLSDIRVSPLTEYSPGGGGERSPAATLPCRATPSVARPSGSAERDPSLRELMTERQRRAALGRGASLPSQQERTGLHEGPAGNALTVTAPQSPFYSKPHRLFADDLTNAPYLPSGAAPLQATRKVGAGGITLRQLFGHEPPPVASPQANRVCGGAEARSSTEVLLSRINNMRAQMK
ncbi:uncharacterized protein Tco025E_05806, partial [Trypanosoma conorhini]